MTVPCLVLIRSLFFLDSRLLIHVSCCRSFMGSIWPLVRSALGALLSMTESGVFWLQGSETVRRYFSKSIQGSGRNRQRDKVAGLVFLIYARASTHQPHTPVHRYHVVRATVSCGGIMPRWMEICSWPTSPYQRVNCPRRSPGYSHATGRIQPLYRQDITGRQQSRDQRNKG